MSTIIVLFSAAAIAGIAYAMVVSGARRDERKERLAREILKRKYGAAHRTPERRFKQ